MTDAQVIRQALPRIVDWYARSRRVLPWREAPTPYHVWISEIMLQQTRIEAVIPYYTRFLGGAARRGGPGRRGGGPAAEALGGPGLLQPGPEPAKGRHEIVEDYGGELPRRAEELKKLPGIGDYTAGAIASIAYGEPEPAVDGNVLRVLSRLLASEDDMQKTPAVKAMTALLREHYPSGEGAALCTEGLMELGETVCVPNGEAKCPLCPLREPLPGLPGRDRGALPGEGPAPPPAHRRADGAAAALRGALGHPARPGEGACWPGCGISQLSPARWRADGGLPRPASPGL